MKTTKKLISIFLSLLMVLSLIPIGAMSALAAEHNINTGSITNSFSLTVRPNDVVKFNVTEETGVFIVTELEGFFGEFATPMNDGEFTNASWAVPSNGTLTVYEETDFGDGLLWSLLFTAKCPNGHKVDTSIEPTDADEDRCIVYCENRPCKYRNNGFEYTHIDSFVCPYCLNEKHAPTHTCSLGSKITGQAAECSVDGWNDYYQCTDATCGKIYATNDTAGTAYDDLDAWKASTAGKINELGHDWGTTPTYGYGAKYHWEVCSRDASHAQNREAHSGGTATCQAKAVCSTCNQEYGDLAEHTYGTTASTTKATDATCTEAATYYVKCDNCTAVSDTATVPVGQPNGHSYATTWSYDEDAHWHAATCGHNTEKSDKADHSYGTEGAERYTCSICDAVNNDKKANADATDLANAKQNAMLAIGMNTLMNSNEEVENIANKAIEDIDNATTIEEVEEIKNKAIDDINNAKEAAEMLKNAKAFAKNRLTTKINGSTDSRLLDILNEYSDKIDNAASIAEAEALADEAIAALDEIMNPKTNENIKTNDSKTSPATGATTMGLGALGLGVALLAVLKKKEND